MVRMFSDAICSTFCLFLDSMAAATLKVIPFTSPMRKLDQLFEIVVDDLVRSVMRAAGIPCAWNAVLPHL